MVLQKNLRFQIVKKLIKKKTSLIDICGGCGWLKDYLDPSIKYTVADASKEFSKFCKSKDISFIRLNCNNLNAIQKKFDYSVMIISLYQFRKNIKKIIKNLKKISRKKIIIVEEILPIKKIDKITLFKNKILDYLCTTNFSKENYNLFSLIEFKALMKKNNFRLINKFLKNNILVGIYETRSRKI